jgi:hypothetical protein
MWNPWMMALLMQLNRCAQAEAHRRRPILAIVLRRATPDSRSNNCEAACFDSISGFDWEMTATLSFCCPGLSSAKTSPIIS